MKSYQIGFTSIFPIRYKPTDQSIVINPLNITITGIHNIDECIDVIDRNFKDVSYNYDLIEYIRSREQ